MTLPEGFDPSMALDALTCDTSCLVHAFVWSDTPQGVEFWREQWSTDALVPEGQRAIRDWLVEWLQGLEIEA